jgi:cyclase
MRTNRREFLLASAAAAVAATFGRPAAGFSRLLQEPTFTPIRLNVGYFTMRGGTIGYLVNEDAVIVVDSQFAAEGAACLEGLNTRSGSRPVDFLINTHHHGDHTGGNISFRGSARHVVAHERAAEHMRQPPGFEPPEEQLYPDTTFPDNWLTDAGDERVRALYYGRAHTSGDVVITFERANVVHMGDLVSNRSHAVVDRAAGASIRNWMNVLEQTVRDHSADTVYIFGHTNTDLPVTGGHADVAHFRDYLGELLTFVEAQVRAGRTRDDILAMREPLAGFEHFGRFPPPWPRHPLACAYDEVTSEP